MTEILLHALIGAIVLLTCMPVHECAHAWAAYKLGDPTAKYQGRITLNPMAHLDLMGSICMIVSSVFGVGLGWAKPVQVNPNNFKNRKLGMGLSALAGPASNFLMAFVIMIIYKLCYYLLDFQGAQYISIILYYMIVLNVGLAVFNFLPIPPLDGSKILLLVLPEKIYFKIMQYERYITLILLVLIFANVLNRPIAFLQQLMLTALNFLTGFVDLIIGAIG
ncbi:MAG: site-2 protease family protein [Oscillospiraceae bacterium]